jgi:hypothetical protein
MLLEELPLEREMCMVILHFDGKVSKEYSLFFGKHQRRDVIIHSKIVY